MRSLFIVFASALVVLTAAAPLGLRVRAQDDGGVRIERHRAPRAPTAPAGDRVITLVRIDPRRQQLRLFGEPEDGQRRSGTDWLRREGLTGVINAGMFLPSGRTVGYMKVNGRVRSDRRPGRFRAVIGFHPTGDASPVGIGGPGCPHRLPWFEEAYDSVLQARKLLLDCQGEAVPWPNRRRYSAALFGVDRRGWVVFVHVRTPYRMTVLARMLEQMDLGLRGLAYMEGGPEATLVVRQGNRHASLVGSWEDGFNPNDDNREEWDLPNVIGFSPR